MCRAAKTINRDRSRAVSTLRGGLIGSITKNSGACIEASSSSIISHCARIGIKKGNSPRRPRSKSSRAQSAESAKGALVEIFDNFGWHNPPIDQIKADQDKFLKGL